MKAESKSHAESILYINCMLAKLRRSEYALPLLHRVDVIGVTVTQVQP